MGQNIGTSAYRERKTQMIIVQPLILWSSHIPNATFTAYVGDLQADEQHFEVKAVATLDWDLTIFRADEQLECLDFSFHL